MKGKLDNGLNRSQAAFVPNEISASIYLYVVTGAPPNDPHTSTREIKVHLQEWIYFPGICASVERKIIIRSASFSYLRNYTPPHPHHRRPTFPTLLMYLVFFLCLFSIVCLNYLGPSSVSTFYIILKLWKFMEWYQKNKLFSVELWFATSFYTFYFEKAAHYTYVVFSRLNFVAKIAKMESQSSSFPLLFLLNRLSIAPSSVCLISIYYLASSGNLSSPQPLSLPPPVLHLPPAQPAIAVVGFIFCMLLMSQVELHMCVCVWAILLQDVQRRWSTYFSAASPISSPSVAHFHSHKGVNLSEMSGVLTNSQLLAICLRSESMSLRQPRRAVNWR